VMDWTLSGLPIRGLKVRRQPAVFDGQRPDEAFSDVGERRRFRSRGLDEMRRRRWEMRRDGNRSVQAGYGPVTVTMTAVPAEFSSLAVPA
jgi:hypothetical protein